MYLIGKSALEFLKYVILNTFGLKQYPAASNVPHINGNMELSVQVPH